MKTAAIKAEDWLTENVPFWNIEQHKSLMILLKEQDRNTRQACAEAVSSLSDEGWLDDAADACMNVKAV